MRRIGMADRAVEPALGVSGVEVDHFAEPALVQHGSQALFARIDASATPSAPFTARIALMRTAHACCLCRPSVPIPACRSSLVLVVDVEHDGAEQRRPDDRCQSTLTPMIDMPLFKTPKVADHQPNDLADATHADAPPMNTAAMTSSSLPRPAACTPGKARRDDQVPSADSTPILMKTKGSAVRLDARQLRCLGVAAERI